MASDWRKAMTPQDRRFVDWVGDNCPVRHDEGCDVGYERCVSCRQEYCFALIERLAEKIIELEAKPRAARRRKDEE